MIANNTTAYQENNTDHWTPHPPLSRTVNILLAGIMIVTLIVGTIGNATVLSLFIKYRSLRTASNIFVGSLTIADLLMCICHLPTLIIVYLQEDIGRQLTQILCYYDTFVGAFTGFGAIWSLMALAIDRLIVLSRTIPVRYPADDTNAYIATVCVWITSLVFAAMPFVGFGQYAVEGSRLSCKSNLFTKSTPNIVYNSLIQVLYFFIPICCMVVCYSRIFYIVRRHELRYFHVRKCESFDEMSFRRMRKSRKLEQNELKTARAGLILISVFCFSWTPYSVVSWIGLFGNRSLLTPLVVVLPAVFAKVSTVFNPLLYALMLRSFKLKLRLFCNQHFKPLRSPFSSSERTHLEVTDNSKFDLTSRQSARL